MTDTPVEEEPTEAPAVAEPELMFGVPVVTVGDQTVLFPGIEDYVEVIETARAAGYFMCLDLCGVDYLSYESDRALPETVVGERFEVVVTLINHNEAKRLRVRVQVPESDPTIPSLFTVHPSVDAMEREAFDMFGINFEGHPQLSRILMPDEWSGYPLRKDYSIGRIPVQFKAPAGR